MVQVETAEIERGRPFLPDPGEGRVALRWLGQAGFAVRHGSFFALIDPYLSDYLAEKHGDDVFSHERMMPAPVVPEALSGLQLVLCTHQHTDHMDPGTLPALAEANPECLFVVPRAERAAALGIGLPAERVFPIDASMGPRAAAGREVEAVPAAHETLEVDENGDYRSLGFIVRLGGVVLYHSGDCVPYDGLAERLGERKIDVALVPVNGRDDFRRERGIVGNFSLEEALGLCRAAAIPVMIAHHFGMFAFNTVDPGRFREHLAGAGDSLRVVVPEMGRQYLLSQSPDERREV